MKQWSPCNLNLNSAFRNCMQLFANEKKKKKKTFRKWFILPVPKCLHFLNEKKKVDLGTLSKALDMGYKISGHQFLHVEKNVLGCFPPAQYHQANLGHQLESQWFNSNLILLTRESIRFRRFLKAQIRSPSSPLKTSCKTQFITCASDPQVIDERFQWAPSLGDD